MQGLIDKILENKPLTFIAAAIALLLAGAVVLFAIRLAFGKRVRAPGGGRTRLPRLGVVDAFDLDRQRQLVIVRRDNVEHLLMIGGPNDLVIESEIIRAEARERHREKEPREKDLREKEPALTPVAAQAGPSAVAAPAWQLDPESVATRTANQPAAWKTPIPPIASPAAATSGAELALTTAASEAGALAADPGVAPRASAFPAAPARRPAPAAPIAPRQPREPLLRADPPLRSEGAAPANPFQRASLATPFLRPPPPRQLAETLARPVNPPTGAPASEQTTLVSAIEGAPSAKPAEVAKPNTLAKPDAPQLGVGADQAPAVAVLPQDADQEPGQSVDQEPGRDLVDAADAMRPAMTAPPAPVRAAEPFDFIAAVAAALAQPEEAPLIAPSRLPDLAETPLAEANVSMRPAPANYPIDIQPQPPAEKRASPLRSLAPPPADDSLEEELAKLLGRGSGGA